MLLILERKRAIKRKIEMLKNIKKGKKIVELKDIIKDISFNRCSGIDNEK